MSTRGSNRVYIGDLGSGGSKQEIEQEFTRFGPLKSVWVARNPPGFAFVEFEDPRDADDAVYEMDGRHVCGVRIRVELAKPTSIPGFRARRGPRPDVVSSRYRNRSRSPSGRGEGGGGKRSRSRSRSRSKGRDRHFKDRSLSPAARRHDRRDRSPNSGRRSRSRSRS